MRSALLAAGLAATLLWGCSPDPPPEEEFQRLGGLGITHMLSGRFQQAEQVLLRQHRLSPENPLPLYNLACLHSMAGRPDLALDHLERAVDAGWDRVDETRRDTDLRPLAELPRFAALLARMEENAARWEARRARAHCTLDPAEAPAYGSLAELRREYARRYGEASARRYLLGDRRGIEAAWRVLDEKIAALRRYAREHPDSADADEAALAVVETLFEYKEDWRFAFWDQDAAEAGEAADRFLETYPESERAPRAALLRARAAWFARLRPADPDALFTAQDLGRVRSLFERVAEDYPGTAAAGQALAHWLDLEFACAGFMVEEPARKVYALLLDRYEGDERVLDYAWEHAREPMFLLEGLSSLEGTDLEGRRWSLEHLRGRVVLVDFWSTGCGSCVERFPELKRLYADYRDRGLQVIGVSLGEEPAATLSRWLDEHGVDWPQLREGRGLRGKLAPRYDVEDLPLGMVLDRKGRVIVAGQDFARLIRTAQALL